MAKRITILGSTGSIGRQALELLSPLGLEVEGLSCGSQVELLLEQALQYRPRLVHLHSEEAALKFRSRWPRKLGACPEILSGEEGLVRLAALPVDTILIAITGFAAVPALASAIAAGQRIGLANKEAIVCAGQIFMPEIFARDITLIPVDSEHSAIWQALKVGPDRAVSRLYLTASGGPFRGWTAKEIESVTPQDALRHPKWQMGPKITIDSASLMNKALELIEAVQLFQVPAETIEVIVHPEALIHSMVGYSDGSIIAQAALPDMRLPIQLALTWPDRVPALTSLPDLTRDFGSIHFEAVDESVFPALRLAREALKVGDLGPCILNAANEMAVGAFLQGEISFPAIWRTVEGALRAYDELTSGLTGSAIRDIMSCDARTRRHVQDCLL